MKCWIYFRINLIGKSMFPRNSTLKQLSRIVSFTDNPSKYDD